MVWRVLPRANPPGVQGRVRCPASALAREQPRDGLLRQGRGDSGVSVLQPFGGAELIWSWMTAS